MIKKIIFASFILASISQKINSQSFAGLYPFTNVTTSSGTTDPTPVPTATGLTFGSFNAVGTPANPNSTLRFNFQNWPTGATDAIDTYNTLTGNINLGEYYQVTLTPSVGFNIDLTSIHFTSQRSSTGMRTYAVRSSLDNYTTNLPASISPSNTNLSVQPGNIFFWNFDATITAQNGNAVTLTPAFLGLTAPVTFRFYGWNTEGPLGNFSIDNVAFAGVANAINIDASFTPSATVVCDGTPVAFVDNTQSFNGPVTAWSWNFGDPSTGPNNTSALQNPTHLFSTCGNYVVKLFATNSNNNTDSALTGIVVNCAPVVAFSGTPVSGCAPLCVNFTDMSTANPIGWSWLFSDLPTSTVQNPNHCFNNPGAYDVTLMAVNANGCLGTLTMVAYINVYAPPVCSYTSSTAGSSVTFTSSVTGNSPFTYSWSFGDGSPGSNSANPVHIYLIDGTYTACLYVTDQNGCMDSTCHNVVIFTTGINSQNSNSAIPIYPNPSADGMFHLNVDQNSVLSFYDLIGKEVRTKMKVNAGINSLDLHEFSNGTYFIKIENETGVITKKISIGK